MDVNHLIRMYSLHQVLIKTDVLTSKFLKRYLQLSTCMCIVFWKSKHSLYWCIFNFCEPILKSPCRHKNYLSNSIYISFTWTCTSYSPSYCTQRPYIPRNITPASIFNTPDSRLYIFQNNLFKVCTISCTKKKIGMDYVSPTFLFLERKLNKRLNPK